MTATPNARVRTADSAVIALLEAVEAVESADPAEGTLAEVRFAIGDDGVVYWATEYRTIRGTAPSARAELLPPEAQQTADRLAVLAAFMREFDIVERQHWSDEARGFPARSLDEYDAAPPPSAPATADDDGEVEGDPGDTSPEALAADQPAPLSSSGPADFAMWLAAQEPTAADRTFLAERAATPGAPTRVGPVAES